ncbi:unnamed protein product [Didymodactylos carnosus]|uniref:Uncharacterized protein n=1 Tax=Didymodactylos carnosus TaxID=1234261 RepID=A0A814D956_9BILA|nr:unnamed protein product [Didymodactylos carnosus]CAF1075052.1 unnamed protein product [Didymodactylos carnosus]CAF3727745.1 unnamed protein product [Didymodactylos carnosus]CAF3838896.1 unnamed protein product [Didymodactylos carnosus]
MSCPRHRIQTDGGVMDFSPNETDERIIRPASARINTIPSLITTHNGQNLFSPSLDLQSSQVVVISYLCPHCSSGHIIPNLNGKDLRSVASPENGTNQLHNTNGQGEMLFSPDIPMQNHSRSTIMSNTIQMPLYQNQQQQSPPPVL